MQKGTRGFTIVEIAVVVVIISVLVTLVMLGFGRTQADTRDSVRTSRTSTIASALEKYYDRNGEYPSCSQLTQAGTVVASSVLQGVDSATLLTPKSGPTDTNSISCSDLTSANDPDVFAYVGDGTTNCSLGASCYEWTIKYIDESTGTIKTIHSRRTTNTVATAAGAPTLAVSAASFTQINASWTSVAGATSYQLQQASDAAFTAGIVDAPPVGSLTTTVNTLASNTTYYFRVKAMIGASPGPWSRTEVAATWGLSTPNVSAVANSPTAFTSSWAAIPHAASYTVQCSSDNVTWGGAGCAGTTAATNYVWGPTNAGYQLYFRTQAVNGAYTSNWSNSATATSPINAPVSAPGVTAILSGTNAIGTATATTCTLGTVYYEMRSRVNDGTWSAWSAWSTTLPTKTISSTNQGFKYTFAVNAICRGPSIDSAVSPTASASVVRPINQPPAPNYEWPSFFTQYVNEDPIYSANCPAGTWEANGTFRDRFVGGYSYGPHPWGYVGSPWIAKGYVEYWGQNQCQTDYAISPMSPESYDYLPVY